MYQVHLELYVCVLGWAEWHAQEEKFPDEPLEKLLDVLLGRFLGAALEMDHDVELEQVFCEWKSPSQNSCCVEVEVQLSFDWEEDLWDLNQNPFGCVEEVLWSEGEG